MSRYTISVFGLGRVGLTIAACFASRGFRVVGFDIDRSKLDMIRRGVAPFYEPGLDELVKRGVESGLLRVTDDYVRAVKESNVTFIAVNTPSKEDGSIDLSFVESASRMVGEGLRYKDEWHLVVVKSTVVPGTTENVVKRIVEEVSGKKAGKDFGLCVSPEFLSEGTAVKNFLYPDRIVIGEIDKRSGDVLENLFKLFYGNKTPPILRTTPANAELIKYASNAFLAMKISFINMIADLCEKIPGCDIDEVARGIGLDKRIGLHFLRAGIGWGGPCFRKDMLALKAFAEKLGVKLPLVDATIHINDTRVEKVINLVKKALGGKLRGMRIAVLGLTYKPGTDDVTDSPSLRLVKALLREGAQVIVYDPKGMENFRRVVGDSVLYANNILDCVKDADCLIIATDWEEFKKLDLEAIAKHMRRPIVVDARRVFASKRPRKLKYIALGSYIGE